MTDNSQAWQKLREIHRQHLKPYGIRLPPETSNKALQLIVLYKAYRATPNKWVHKDKISAVVRVANKTAATDQQIRHLRADGWNIENDNRGNHRFIEPTKASPEVVKQSVKRTSLMTATSFKDIKKAHHNRCITCGSQEGEPNWRYGDTPVNLEKGHLDPAKPEVKENILPQCQFCNKAYKSDYVFDEKGRVKAVASIDPVKKASKQVKEQIWEYLNAQFKSSP